MPPAPVELPIETNRLILRRYEDRDVGDILEYSQEADYWLARNLDWTPAAGSIRAYFEAQRDQKMDEFPQWVNLMMELKSERKVIGCVGIGVTNREQGQASIGWMLGCRYQGQGLATEAARAGGFRFLLDGIASHLCADRQVQYPLVASHGAAGDEARGALLPESQGPGCVGRRICVRDPRPRVGANARGERA